MGVQSQPAQQLLAGLSALASLDFAGAAWPVPVNSTVNKAMVADHLLVVRMNFLRCPPIWGQIEIIQAIAEALVLLSSTNAATTSSRSAAFTLFSSASGVSSANTGTLAWRKTGPVS